MAFNSAPHIILIGFKHTGKSTLAGVLAARLDRQVIDLDAALEAAYQQRHHRSYPARRIMQEHGPAYFYSLEAEVLSAQLLRAPAVIALGGGAALNSRIQRLIKGHFVLHVRASKPLVMQRVLASGLPAFVSYRGALNHCWIKRNKVYRRIKTCSVRNHGAIDEVAARVEAILMQRGVI